MLQTLISFSIPISVSNYRTLGLIPSPVSVRVLINTIILPSGVAFTVEWCRLKYGLSITPSTIIWNDHQNVNDWNLLSIDYNWRGSSRMANSDTTGDTARTIIQSIFDQVFTNISPNDLSHREVVKLVKVVALVPCPAVRIEYQCKRTIWKSLF